MANNLPSATPEIPGDNEATANAPNDKGKNSPAPKFKPRHHNPRSWFFLTPAKRRELLGFLVLVPWVWTEFIGSHNIWQLLGLAATLAVAHNAILSFWSWRRRKAFWGIWMITIIPLTIIVRNNSRPLGLEPPLLSIAQIPLSDGRNFPDNEISIFNPNGVTIYWTTLEIVPSISISPASLDIEIDQPPESERSLQRGPICDFFRINRYPSKTQPNCKGVEIQLRTLPPLSYRFIRIDGTIATNCSANLSVAGYTNRLNLLGMPNVSGFTPQMQLMYSGTISNLSLSSHSNAIFNVSMDFLAQ